MPWVTLWQPEHNVTRLAGSFGPLASLGKMWCTSRNRALSHPFMRHRWRSRAITSRLIRGGTEAVFRTPGACTRASQRIVLSVREVRGRAPPVEGISPAPHDGHTVTTTW
jgi:hypothetical protein